MTESNSKLLKIIATEIIWLLLSFPFAYFIAVLLISVAVVMNMIFKGIFHYSLFNEINYTFLAAFPCQSISILLISFWRRKKVAWQILEWKKSSSQTSIIKKQVLGFSVALILIVLVYLNTIIVYQLFGENEILKIRWEFIQYLNLPEKLYILFIGGVIAPIAEELYFRELMFGNFIREGFTKTAYIFTCIVFAAVHLDIFNLIGYSLYGIGLAFLYQKTRSLISPITAHITINLILISLMLFT